MENKRTVIKSSSTTTKSPSHEWEVTFKSTLNRLATQYLLLLRAASSEVALEEEMGNDSDNDNNDYEERMDVDDVNNNSGSNNKINDVVGGGGEKRSGSGSSVNNLVDPRGGGGRMTSLLEPPPPLASSVSISALQTNLSTQNIITASNTLLDLIRIMRCSATVMDGTSVLNEEEVECWENGIVKDVVDEEAEKFEREWMEMKVKELLDIIDHQ